MMEINLYPVKKCWPSMKEKCVNEVVVRPIDLADMIDGPASAGS